jgi:hypothetical protein
MNERPEIPNAPGLVWRARAGGWAATWQARSDLVRKGYTPKTVPLWTGASPDEKDRYYIETQCLRLQADMLLWSKGGTATFTDYRGDVRSLTSNYQTHPLSKYKKVRYGTRKSQDGLLRRINAQYADVKIADIDAVWLIEQHAAWSDDGVKAAMGHLFIGQMRNLFKFGKLILKDPECRRLCEDLSDMQFPMPGTRETFLTAEQIIAHRSESRMLGYHSLARGQALQFECTMRQKDVIGEWIPLSEPGVSDVSHPRLGKWDRGLRWEEIDEHLILRHVTSKKQKKIVVDLHNAPMVLEELGFMLGVEPQFVRRDLLPAAGPIIIDERSGYPWKASEYRRKWREVANRVGIPKNVWNMDTRSGAITEATDAGAALEDTRHAAAHSQVSMTARYSRGSEQKIAKVMQLRVEARNKPKT